MAEECRWTVRKAAEMKEEAARTAVWAARAATWAVVQAREGFPGVYLNDSQIKRREVTMCEPCKPGCVVVWIKKRDA